MTYMDKSIRKIHESLINGKVTSDELVKESLMKYKINVMLSLLF